MDRSIQNDWVTLRFNDDIPSVHNEMIAIESPFTVMLNGQEFATLVCSPTDIDDLLVGFLASEGIIRSHDEITSISIDKDRGFAYIELVKTLERNQGDHSKRFIGSCCGKSRQFYLKNDVKTAKTVNSQVLISVNQCYSLMNQLQQASKHFKETGGVHNAALATVNDILTIRTDIGRHNALDKIYGDIIKNHISLKNKVIVFSGRISSEVLLKVSKIGIGILLSKSAPSDLALNLANDLGITTIGFIRGDKMNVYTHPRRILEAKDDKTSMYINTPL